MMTGPIFRLARPDDVAAVVRLVRNAYAADRARLTGIPDVTEGLDAEVASGSVHVAEHDGAIRGVIILSLRHDDMWIANLAVAPEAQGQGVGSGLMRLAEDSARAAGCVRMRLKTHIGLTRTLGMYRHLGWVETGRTGYTVAMECAL